MERTIYDTIEDCLERSRQIMCDCRRQRFYYALKELGSLTSTFLELLSYFTDESKKAEGIFITEQEFLQVFQDIVQAQEKKDYILLADMVEIRLIPFLQDLLEKTQAAGLFAFGDYWAENRKLLETGQKELLPLLEAPQSGSTKYVLEAAVNGAVTVRVEEKEYSGYYHSIVNPQQEAREYVSYISQMEAEHYVVYGVGFGYMVEELARQFPEKSIAAFEPDLEMLQIAFRYRSLEKLLQSHNVKLILGNGISDYLKKDNGVLLVHYPSLQRIQDRQFRESMEEYFLSVNSMLNIRKRLAENFYFNQKSGYSSIDMIEENFLGKDMIIVAGGPSLTDDMEQLKHVPEYVNVVAVGRCAKALKKAGIRVDYVAVSDVDEVTKLHISGFDGKQCPLLLLSTAAHETAEAYQGPVYVVYQSGYERACEAAAEKGLRVFSSGFSVATLPLGIGIAYGAKTIICVGMDLAFPDGKTYAAGMEDKDFEQNGAGKTVFSGFRKVEGVTKEYVETAACFDIPRKWIEKRVKENPDVCFINTSRGARIHGMKEMPLVEALKQVNTRRIEAMHEE